MNLKSNSKIKISTSPEQRKTDRIVSVVKLAMSILGFAMALLLYLAKSFTVTWVIVILLSIFIIPRFVRWILNKFVFTADQTPGKGSDVKNE